MPLLALLKFDSNLLMLHSENCGFELDVENNFPQRAQRLDFIRHYLKALQPAEDDAMLSQVIAMGHFENGEFIEGFEVRVVYCIDCCIIMRSNWF